MCVRYKPVWNSVQYYTIIHSFLPDGYGIVSDVSTIQITLAQYSVISQIRPNFLLDLSICPVLMRPMCPMCPFGRNGKQNASIYSVHIYFEIPHIDANLTSLRETFRETFI